MRSWPLALALTLAACGGRPASVSAPSPAPAAPPPHVELADRDGDGVPDVCDWCPGEPGIDRVDHPMGRGCPYVDCFGGGDELRVAFERDQTQAPPLGDLAVKLRAHTGWIVVGHASTDERDPERTAEERARSIVAALVAAGVDAARVEAHSAGAAHPLSDAAASRRVDLEPTQWCSRSRRWDEKWREVVAVPKGEVDSCPAPLRQR